MAPAGTGRSGTPEGAQDEAAEEGPPSANPSVHENILVLLQFGPVVLDVPRAVLDVRAYDPDVAPAEVRLVDMVWPEVAQHASSPSQGLVRFVPVHHHA